MCEVLGKSLMESACPIQGIKLSVPHDPRTVQCMRVNLDRNSEGKCAGISYLLNMLPNI